MAEFEKQPPVALPATARWHSVLRHAVGSRRSLLGAAGWVSATFIAQQTLRLVSNIILAWLLAPALLGTMLLINTLRTGGRSEEHTSELQSLMRTAYAVFRLKKKTRLNNKPQCTDRKQTHTKTQHTC